MSLYPYFGRFVDGNPAAMMLSLNTSSLLSGCCHVSPIIYPFVIVIYFSLLSTFFKPHSYIVDDILLVKLSSAKEIFIPPSAPQNAVFCTRTGSISDLEKESSKLITLLFWFGAGAIDSVEGTGEARHQPELHQHFQPLLLAPHRCKRQRTWRMRQCHSPVSGGSGNRALPVILCVRGDLLMRLRGLLPSYFVYCKGTRQKSDRP